MTDASSVPSGRSDDQPVPIRAANANPNVEGGPMTELEAIDIIARYATAARTEDISDDWENYPDIGEADWEAIVQRAAELAPTVGRREYDEAYALLSARANVEEAP